MDIFPLENKIKYTEGTDNTTIPLNNLSVLFDYNRLVTIKFCLILSSITTGCRLVINVSLHIA